MYLDAVVAIKKSLDTKVKRGGSGNPRVVIS